MKNQSIYIYLPQEDVKTKLNSLLMAAHIMAVEGACDTVKDLLDLYIEIECEDRGVKTQL